MDDEQILEKDGYMFTNNISEAIYIFPSGHMLWGEFDCGSRGVDHRCIEAITKKGRYDKGFWQEVFEKGLVMVIPETQEFSFPRWMATTSQQDNIIDQLKRNGYTYGEFK